MSGRGQIKLAIDVRREQRVEKEAFDAFNKRVREQGQDAIDAQKKGSIWGAIGGFLMSAMFGWNPLVMVALSSKLGGNISYWNEVKGDLDENVAMLAQDVYGGGKFNKNEMKDIITESKEDMIDFRKAQKKGVKENILDAVKDSLISSVITPWSPQDKANWKDLKIGQKIGQFARPFRNPIEPAGAANLKNIAGPWAEGLSKEVLASPELQKQGFFKNLWQGGKGMMMPGTKGDYLGRQLTGQDLGNYYERYLMDKMGVGPGLQNAYKTYNILDMIYGQSKGK